MARSSAKVRLGWYVIVNGEQVAWYFDRKKAVAHAKAAGGHIEREQP